MRGEKSNKAQRRADVKTAQSSPHSTDAASPPSSVHPHPSLWRVFCAIGLPGDVRSRVAGHIARLRESAPEIRASWDKAEKLHITLKFLGEIEQSRIQDLSHAVERATKSVHPFNLSIEKAGAFPPRGSPRVLWLGIADLTGQLAHLQNHLEDECARLGFARERRSFHPHLTIARLRTPQGARRLAALHQQTGFAAAEFTVTGVVVIRSEPGAGGSRYTKLSRHMIGD